MNLAENSIKSQGITAAVRKTGISRAQQNRAIRQEAIREQLEAQKHLEHVLDITLKLQDLNEDLDQLQVQRLAKVIDTKLKLVNKYLPDLKSVELTGEINHNNTSVSEEELQLLHRLRNAIDVTPG